MFAIFVSALNVVIISLGSAILAVLLAIIAIMDMNPAALDCCWYFNLVFIENLDWNSATYS